MGRKIDGFPGHLERVWVRKPFVTRKGNNGCLKVLKIVLTEEQTDWLRRWFPLLENNKLMKMSGLSHSALHRYAREFGLTKSEKGLAAIKKKQAAHIKRVCEKNGYYDSLRGRPPSDACRRATAKMWQEVRDGKREHPMRIIKRQNPKRYKKILQRKSVQRKETIRKEKMRIAYGLERKTKLKCVVICKFTKSQVCHRYNALRRGYFFMKDCSEAGGYRYNIYYDQDTERSEKFERNLINDGFRLIDYET